MKEVTIGEILKLKDGSIYFVYNPLTNITKEEVTGKNDIAHNKHRYEKLRYFIKEEK